MVAPFTGAWVEIIGLGLEIDHKVESLPSRERGLKYQKHVGRSHPNKSLPSRERGLKSVSTVSVVIFLGRSLPGSVG